MDKRVTILIFSSRINGNCTKTGEFIQENYQNSDCFTYRIDHSNFAPCGHCDYECLKPGPGCPNLTALQVQLMDRICESDLVYFILPNYCGGPCANYWAFNERSVGYFHLDSGKMAQYLAVQKRFIIISNTEGFTDAMQQQTDTAPVILYLKSKQYRKQSIAGDILDSEQAREDLIRFLGPDLE